MAETGAGHEVGEQAGGDAAQPVAEASDAGAASAEADRIRRDLEVLEARLGRRFRDRDLLVRALTHRSFANEASDDVEDNEVLEFLGDAVLGLIVSHVLVERYPYLREGQMSKLKSFLVSAQTLGHLAEELDLGSFMLLGRGEEKTDGRGKESILANALEAVIAALYLDAGLEPARRFVLDHVEPLLVDAVDSSEALRDFKSTLQERLQAAGLPLPEYVVDDEEGPDHEKVFHVRVLVPQVLEAGGSGRTKKQAQQRAARRALQRLEKAGY